MWRDMLDYICYKDELIGLDMEFIGSQLDNQIKTKKDFYFSGKYVKIIIDCNCN